MKSKYWILELQSNYHNGPLSINSIKLYDQDNKVIKESEFQQIASDANDEFENSPSDAFLIDGNENFWNIKQNNEEI